MSESSKIKAGTFLKIEFKKASDKQVIDLKCLTEILFDPKTLRVEEDKHDDFRALIGQIAHDVDVTAVMNCLKNRFNSMIFAESYTENSIYGKGQALEISLHLVK